MYTVKNMFMGQACVKEIVNGYVVSIAFDDSCGSAVEMTRTDIRIFDKFDSDVINDVVKDINCEGGVIVGNIKNLIDVYSWCKSH